MPRYRIVMAGEEWLYRLHKISNPAPCRYVADIQMFFLNVCAPYWPLRLIADAQDRTSLPTLWLEIWLLPFRDLNRKSSGAGSTSARYACSALWTALLMTRILFFPRFGFNNVDYGSRLCSFHLAVSDTNQVFCPQAVVDPHDPKQIIPGLDCNRREMAFTSLALTDWFYG